MNHDQAFALVQEYIKTPNIIKHLLATEAQMRALASKFRQDEEKWGLAGLVHDLDWDITKSEPEKHSLLAEKILKEKGFDPEIVSAVKIHNYVHEIEPKTLLEKALYCSEMMTGFVVAVTLVQPSKKLADVTVEKIMKKYKEKSFGAGAKREIMNLAPEYLGISLEELARITLEAMQGISTELGL
ncbi:MAG: HDIG domain-containing protein [Candidatus Portnoybacteria bacterium]|nr:HDIG domain-containing protein [Candidatus Portnoybacteria bacterium]